MEEVDYKKELTRDAHKRSIGASGASGASGDKAKSATQMVAENRSGQLSDGVADMEAILLAGYDAGGITGGWDQIANSNFATRWATSPEGLGSSSQQVALPRKRYCVPTQVQQPLSQRMRNT